MTWSLARRVTSSGGSPPTTYIFTFGRCREDSRQDVFHEEWTAASMFGSRPHEARHDQRVRIGHHIGWGEVVDIDTVRRREHRRGHARPDAPRHFALRRHDTSRRIVQRSISSRLYLRASDRL